MMNVIPDLVSLYWQCLPLVQYISFIKTTLIELHFVYMKEKNISSNVYTFWLLGGAVVTYFAAVTHCFLIHVVAGSYPRKKQ
jgi:hypothetical protein